MPNGSPPPIATSFDFWLCSRGGRGCARGGGAGCKGPYIAGEEPTDSDFALIPKLKHLQIALAYYYNWEIPSEYTATHIQIRSKMSENIASWRTALEKTLRIDAEEWAQDEQAMWECMVTGEGQSSVSDGDGYRRGGSRPGKRPNIDRERQQGHERIWNDYFSEQPVYPERLFRRRYRMRKPLFWRIHNAICQNDPYFVQKKDAAGLLGLSSIQKMTAALRMLSLGVSADALDEYVRIGESTAMKSLKRFAASIRAIFQDQYLRQPTKEDMEGALSINQERGFPGMFASIDCMHYEWKNCPVAWQGLFTNKDGHKSIVLEAIADHKLWFWHAYFGLPGGNNDRNVLDRSPLVNNFLRSESDEISFIVNNRQYAKYYLLADGIYPDWSIFVKTIQLPQGNARKWFARCQEGARKDVERAFGVLQQRFAIVRNPVRVHFQHEIKDILLCCIILHNMIIEDECNDTLPADWDFSPRARAHVGKDLGTLDWQEYLAATRAIEDSELHFGLRADLVAHLWRLRGQGHRFAYVGNQDL